MITRLNNGLKTIPKLWTRTEPTCCNVQAPQYCYRIGNISSLLIGKVLNTKFLNSITKPETNNAYDCLDVILPDKLNCTYALHEIISSASKISIVINLREMLIEAVSLPRLIVRQRFLYFLKDNKLSIDINNDGLQMPETIQWSTNPSQVPRHSSFRGKGREIYQLRKISQ